MDIYVSAHLNNECELYCRGKLYVVNKGHGEYYAEGKYVDKILEIIKSNEVDTEKDTIYVDNPQTSIFNKTLIKHLEKRKINFKTIEMGGQF